MFLDISYLFLVGCLNLKAPNEKQETGNVVISDYHTHSAKPLSQFLSVRW